MHRKLSICAALAAVAVIANALPAPNPTAPKPAPTPAPAGCPNVFVVEPMVMLDSTGFGLGGPLHRHMTAYNNGLVSVSRGFGFPGEVDGAVDFTWLPAAEVIQLARDLYDAGAWNICDQPMPLPDTPLTTVTVFRGATNAPSHTYSYFTPTSTEAQAAAGILWDFMSEHFPGF